MLDSSIDWTAASTVLSGFAVFFVIALIPLGLWFHRKVIRPLGFVLGLKATESPTGEEIPSIPVQLAELRKGYVEMRTTQVRISGHITSIQAELHPDSGSSLRDSMDRSEAITKAVHLQVVDLQKTVETHMADERKEREKVSALALKTAAELAALTAQTAKDLAHDSPPKEASHD